jgi:hypothetical protein
MKKKLYDDIICVLCQILSGDQLKKYKMGGSHRTQRDDEKFIHNFSWKKWSEDL